MLKRTLWESAVELSEFLESQGFNFCFIGGIALQRWGEPRMTDDLDLTVVLPFGEEQAAAKKILPRYQSRHPSPLSFAIEARILLLQDIAGTEIDLSIGGMPFEYRMLDSASPWIVPGGGQIVTCSAEYLVVLKAFASRDQDWIDIENVVQRQGEQLDRTVILEELEPLAGLKEEPEILEKLNRLFDRN